MMKPRRWLAEGCGPIESPGSRERADRACSCATGDKRGVPQGLSDAIRAALNTLGRAAGQRDPDMVRRAAALGPVLVVHGLRARGRLGNAQPMTTAPGNGGERSMSGHEVTTTADGDTPVTDAFKLAMSRLAAGVAMVTCHVDGKPWGLTISACCSVSMEPPLLMVSLATGTVSAQTITETGSFGVSLLGESLLDVAQFGSSRGQAKFVEEFCRDADGSLRSPAVAGGACPRRLRSRDHRPGG